MRTCFLSQSGLKAEITKYPLSERANIVAMLVSWAKRVAQNPGGNISLVDEIEEGDRISYSS